MGGLMHIEARRGMWGDPRDFVFRVYGNRRPLKRCCLFDITRFMGKTRVRLGPWTVYHG